MKEIGSSIWQADSDLPGPHVIVLGGVHGDEKTGIEVIKTLQGILDKGDKETEKRKLTLILGNEEAIKIGKRVAVVGGGFLRSPPARQHDYHSPGQLKF